MDNTDYKILDILQRDGRISMQRLSREINMSTPATIERVRKLEENGSIVGYRAMVRPERVGREVLAYVTLDLEYSKRDKFYQMVEDCDAIISVFEVTGGQSHIIEISCRDMDEFQRTVYGLYGMGSTKTYVVLDNIKNGIFKKIGDTPGKSVLGRRGEYSPAKSE